MRGEDAGQPAHAGADQYHRPPDLVQHPHNVGVQRIDRVVAARGAVAVSVPTRVEGDDVEPALGQDLPGVLPGVPVLPASVQQQHGGLVGCRLVGVPLVADQT